MAIAEDNFPFFSVMFATIMCMLGPNKHGLVTYIQVNVLEIHFPGSMVAELSKLTYVEDKCIISYFAASVHIFEFSSKSNGSIYYL